MFWERRVNFRWKKYRKEPFALVSVYRTMRHAEIKLDSLPTSRAYRHGTLSKIALIIRGKSHGPLKIIYHEMKSAKAISSPSSLSLLCLPFPLVEDVRVRATHPLRSMQRTNDDAAWSRATPHGTPRSELKIPR